MRTHINYLVAGIGLIFITSISLLAQESGLAEKGKHRIGFITGIADQNFGGMTLGVQYDYEVTFYQFEYSRLLFGNDRWDVDLVVQPQYNMTRFRPVNNDPEKVEGFEYGVSVGVLARRNIINDFLTMYVLVSIGPHYISGAPRRQVDGFIFSDNFFAGVSLRVFKNTYLDFRPGFRHISNANIRFPNQGINTIVMNVGAFLDL